MRHLLIFTLFVLLLSGAASAKGQISTVDIGYYNADEMKQAVPFAEREWANGTYSNTRLDPGGLVTFDIRDHLTITSSLTITPTSGNWKWYPANQSGNMVFYRNALANVSYTDWDTILKEQIILNAPVSSISWQINLSVRPQTLTVTVDGDDYLIKDPANTGEWIRVRRPFVVDANGVKRNLRYTWNNGQRRLTLVQDFSGLTYPLTIDPVYSVDTTGATGAYPVLLVNQSNIPQIIYQIDTPSIKLAVNKSGSFTLSSIVSTPSTIVYEGAAIDNKTTDLPVIFSAGRGASDYNFSWSYNGKYKFCQTYPYFPNIAGWPGPYAMGVSSSTGRTLIAFRNGSSGDYNITRIEDITGSSITPYQHIIEKAFTPFLIAESGKMNTSNILNILWVENNAYIINWTTVTDSATPSITTIKTASTQNVNSTGIWVAADMNPTTGFPGVAYKPYEYGATTGRAVNYSYFSSTTNHWYHEIAYVNTTVGGMSAIYYGAIAFNSSGTPYIVYDEKANGAGSTAPNIYVNYIKRLGANSWSTPVTLRGGTNYYSPTIAFDQQDNLHIAWHNATTGDLEYYFEALPVAAGAAPVAAFACTPLAVVRNQTITCTDASTNTPTSWDWYSPDASQQVLFSGNITNQNPSFFPHKLGGYFSVNLIATNAYGTSTKASGARYIWVQKPFVGGN